MIDSIIRFIVLIEECQRNISSELKSLKYTLSIRLNKKVRLSSDLVTPLVQNSNFFGRFTENKLFER